MSAPTYSTWLSSSIRSMPSATLRPKQTSRRCFYYGLLNVFPSLSCSEYVGSEDNLYCIGHQKEHLKEQEEKKNNKRKQSKLYTIEKIAGKKMILEGNNWQVYYNIKWFGYPASQNTWEPKESLEKTAKETVEDYEQQTEKPKKKVRFQLD